MCSARGMDSPATRGDRPEICHPSYRSTCVSLAEAKLLHAPPGAIFAATFSRGFSTDPRNSFDRPCHLANQFRLPKPESTKPLVARYRHHRSVPIRTHHASIHRHPRHRRFNHLETPMQCVTVLSELA